MSDRKYRQHGYQDRGDQKPQRSSLPGGPAPPRPDRDNTYGPRALNMLGARNVSRCGECGTVLQMLTEPLGNCPQCGAALHACKQCAHFDPASRFECRKTILERVVKKSAANQCTQFELTTRVERETTTPGGGGRADDARKAFENLFKK